VELTFSPDPCGGLDSNGDQVLDLDDFANFQACFVGPAQ
jgi:hypothetical protein